MSDFVVSSFNSTGLGFLQFLQPHALVQHVNAQTLLRVTSNISVPAYKLQQCFRGRKLCHPADIIITIMIIIIKVTAVA